MKKIQLSNSAKDKYIQCPAMYKNHYIDRIRPVRQSSALYFGGAVDEALNVLLESKKSDLNKPVILEKDILKTANQIFETHWEAQRKNDKVDYFKSDIDLDLLDTQDIVDLLEFDSEVENHEEFIQECFTILKNKEKMCEEDQKLYNYIAWHCLYRKGLMLIEAYYNDILPQIHTVFDIQKKVMLPDEHGNFIVGYIDAIVSFIDAPDERVVLDNKTSSKPYTDDSVASSEQLCTYCEHEGLAKAAYAVVEKKIRKRKPKTRTQLIIDKIPEETFDKTFEIYDNVLEGIENEEFDKNYDSGCFFFGSVCPYYRYCRTEGKDKEGLEEV